MLSRVVKAVHNPSLSQYLKGPGAILMPATDRRLLPTIMNDMITSEATSRTETTMHHTKKRTKD